MNKSFKQGHRPAVTRLASACLGALLGSVIALPAAAYTIDEVLVAEDQHFGEAGLTPAPLYKPHEVVVSQNPNPNKNIWISSNERSGFAGITIFDGSNNVRATLNIEEPGLDWTEEPEEEEIGGTEEEPPEENFPPEVRLDPVICLPVRLPPGALPPTLTVGKGNNKETFQVTSFDEDRICAPLGAEMHARHPHGIDMDRVREIAYQVIEHSGLNWNADRTAFEIAETTDDESAMLLAYDVSDPDDPVIIDGYLLGHGGHEVAVNENNGKVFQGNHEDSPTATPNVWVDVIEPTDANPYGFIDTGWYNAVQGIEVDESLNQVFGTTHVGERMFAFDGDCVSLHNASANDEQHFGENCILYSVDLRGPFFDQIPEAVAIFEIADQDLKNTPKNKTPTELPSVLHMHDLTVDPVNHRAYQTLHSIHHAEHTGSPEEAELSAPKRNEVEEEHHFQGRWLAEVDVDPNSPNFQQVTYIDLSNGQNVLDVPNSEDVVPGTPFEDRYIHAHWVAVDPAQGTVLVTGEHTGNLGVVNQGTRVLGQVVAISTRFVDGCDVAQPPINIPGNSDDNPGKGNEQEPPEVAEPHVHGVQIDQLTGTAYVSDEGEEECFFESVTILNP